MAAGEIPAFAHMRFAKTAMRGARFPLTLSGVAEASLADVDPSGESARRIEGSGLAAALSLWREGIAARYGVAPGHAFPALGASGSTFLAMAAVSSLLPAGAAIAVERPAFGVFEACARWLGREVVHVERRAEERWAVDVAGVGRALRGGVRVFCLTDLHNPTGAAVSDEEAAALRDLARRHDAWIVLDEVYRDFRPGPVGTGYRPGERVVCTSSLTKCYGLGGLRAGFLFAPPEVVERAERIEELVLGLPPTPTAALAAASLGRADDLLARGRAAAAAGRPVIDAWIAETPHVSWVPPAAGITGLLRVEGVTDSVRFAARLREELDVQVVPGAWFGAEGHVRVSFGLPPESLAAALCVFGMGLGALVD